MAADHSFRRIVFVLVGGAAFGKITGFVREVLMAQAVGVTVIADGFRAAMTAIMLPLAIVQGDTVPAVLIPLARRWQGDKIAARFIALSLVLTCFGLLIMIAVEIWAGQWVGLLVEGFTPDGQRLTTSFVRVMALSMPSIIWFACLSSVELAAGRARFNSIRQGIQNIATMLGIAVMLLTGEPIALAWGVTSALVLVPVYATAVLIREGKISLRDVSLPLAWQSTKVFLEGFRAVAVLPFIEQLNVGVERFLSSSVGGTVAALDYARTISDTTLLLVSEPIGLAILAHTDHDMERREVLLRIRIIARPLLICAMPASILMALTAPNIVQAVLARGAFDHEAVRLTSQGLSGVSLGLWASALGYILFRQLNGLRQNGKAIIVLLIAYALNIAVNFALAAQLGPLGFGLGQTVRGLTLVVGMSLALHCTPMVFGFVLQNVPGCLLIWLGWTQIALLHQGNVIKLLFSLLLYMSIVGCSFAIYMPAGYRRLFRQINGRFS